MDREQERVAAKRAYDREWEIQPKWVKRLTCAVALPAWLVLAWDVFTDQVSDGVASACFAAFAVVVFVQIFYGIRAQKRGDL